MYSKNVAGKTMIFFVHVGTKFKLNDMKPVIFWKEMSKTSRHQTEASPHLPQPRLHLSPTR